MPAEGRAAWLSQLVRVFLLSIATLRMREEAAHGASSMIHTVVDVVNVIAAEEIHTTISWAGTLARGMLLFCAWFVARLVWNRMMHALAGSSSRPNPKNGQPRKDPSQSDPARTVS